MFQKLDMRVTTISIINSMVPLVEVVQQICVK